MKPELKVVGEIKPPPYKDPATMLRNIADEIEQGNLDVNTIAVVYWGPELPLAIYGGGRDSEMYHLAFAFGAAQQRLLLCANHVAED